MKKRDLLSIGDIYGDMLKPLRKELLVKESKEPKSFDGEFRKKKQKDGPEVADGYNKAENKPKEEDEELEGEEDAQSMVPKKKKNSINNSIKSMEDALKKPGISEKTKKDLKRRIFDLGSSSEYSEEEEIKESKKISREILNKHMSKSYFDKLYSKVLKENFNFDSKDEGSDVDALGLDDATPDSEMDDDFGGEDDLGGEEDSVTFTLDRATAQALMDVLQGALGGEEDLGDDDLGFEDEGDDLDFGDEGDDDMNFDEDEEVQGTKVAPDKKAAFQAKSNKVGGKANPKGSGKAKTDVTDEVGTKDGAPPITALQGKNNQVPGSTLKKASDYFR